MDEAVRLGFDFTFAKSQKRGSHFSTLKTMKEWMENVYVPYRDTVVREEGLPADQKSILFLDCYPVHLSEDFRTYIRSQHPNVFLVYVPAGCTGIFQPADVGLQRVIKHQLKQHALDFLVRSHADMLSDGIKPEDVRFTQSLPVLRDTSVDATVKVWHFLKGGNGPEIIRKAWEKCIVRDWCLSPKLLTDPKMKRELQQYLASHSHLRSEIEAKIGQLPGVDEEPSDVGDADTDLHASEVSIAAVVEHEFGVDVRPTGDTAPLLQDPHDGLAAEGDLEVREGHLMSAGVGDNIDAFRDDGTSWDEYMQAAQHYML
ncbi:hypothetical protein PsYK624_109330 [Phanerochaete sordida]|uniref:DDE-1 domain-containing protein n=1 Tax=Phanerochaete sordida TaxID=48140 RepID=A0A9P3GGZ4_9APHY|nr:hypothetical protein PsYK624_109330 [Phanerochaete sordida]